MSAKNWKRGEKIEMDHGHVVIIQSRDGSRNLGAVRLMPGYGGNAWNTSAVTENGVVSVGNFRMFRTAAQAVADAAK